MTSKQTRRCRQDRENEHDAYFYGGCLLRLLVPIQPAQLGLHIYATDYQLLEIVSPIIPHHTPHQHLQVICLLQPLPLRLAEPRGSSRVETDF